MSATTGKPSNLPPVADIAADLRDGHDIADVATALGVTVSQLRYRLNAAGWDSAGDPLEDCPRREHVVGFLQGDTSWMADAVCAEVDPDLFFGEFNRGAKEAKALCARCPVRDACEAAAESAGESYGIWGGRERGRKRRKGSAA